MKGGGEDRSRDVDLDLDVHLDLEGLVHEGSKDLLKYIKLR